ncbi:hypothetical protein A4A49_57960, partial [Nicotiana attenuata]
SEYSSSSNGLNRRWHYGLTANYFMAWIPLNARRRFFKCPKHEDEKYSYWVMVKIEELPPRKEKEALIHERNALQRKI